MTVCKFSTHSFDNPLLPPDNHHSSDVVYRKGGVRE